MAEESAAPDSDDREPDHVVGDVAFIHPWRDREEDST